MYLIRKPAIHVTAFTVMTRFDPCGPASNSGLMHTDPCWPAAANIKEKLVKLRQTRVDQFRTTVTSTNPYLPFSYSGNQLLNPYTKTVPSRFSYTLTICKLHCTFYSGTTSAHFHPHQIRFGTRLCVTVAIAFSRVSCVVQEYGIPHFQYGDS
jgi:hypothetical protein